MADWGTATWGAFMWGSTPAAIGGSSEVAFDGALVLGPAYLELTGSLELTAGSVDLGAYGRPRARTATPGAPRRGRVNVGRRGRAAAAARRTVAA